MELLGFRDGASGKPAQAAAAQALRETAGLRHLEVDLDPEGHEVKAPDILRQAEPGDSLVLTIDTKVQKNAQKALKWAMDRIGVKRGAFLAMNPQNGEILAMVSLPAYDNNQFAQGISMSEYTKLLEDPSKPMLNVAVNEQYPPGSTLKPFVGLGGLEQGIITRHTHTYCPGFYQLPGKARKYRDWKRVGHGSVDLISAIADTLDLDVNAALEHFANIPKIVRRLQTLADVGWDSDGRTLVWLEGPVT